MIKHFKPNKWIRWNWKNSSIKNKERIKFIKFIKKRRNQKLKIKILINYYEEIKILNKLIHKQNFIPYLNEFALENKSYEGWNNFFSQPYFLSNFCKLWRIKFAIFFARCNFIYYKIKILLSLVKFCIF
jgi:hypothetical protein